MIIYQIINTVNFKSYIGQHKGTKVSTRWTKKLTGGNAHFASAVAKYGWKAFEIQIRNFCTSQEEMDNYEKLWIISLGTYDPKFGYNMTFGGDAFGWALTEEVKSRMSLSAKTSPKAIAHREDLWKKTTGVPKTQEHKDKIRDALKATPDSLEQRKNQVESILAIATTLPKEQKWVLVKSVRQEVYYLRQLGVNISLPKITSYEELYGSNRAQQEAQKRGRSIAKTWEGLSFEEKSKEVKRRTANRKRSCWTGITPEERSIELRRRRLKSGDKGTFKYITDGTHNKRVSIHSEVPEGWKQGQWQFGRK
jgi:hypothetical protein